MRPKCYDGFCGLGGWSEGFIAEGWDVTGFDIEAHEYGDQKYPGKLVIRNMLTVHGSELADAACLVMSPPCQEYSYMAMPFSRGKKIAAALRGQGEFPDGYTGSRTIEELNRLFDACFRIQREASEAAGRHVPMVVENVKGAQPWVGKAKAHFGSFFLWGDVEMVGDRVIAGGLRWESVRAARRGAQKHNPDGTAHGQGSWFKVADSKERGTKNDGGSWFAIRSPGQTAVGQNPVSHGRNVPGMNFHDYAKTGKPGRSFQSAAVHQKQPIWFNDDKRRGEKFGGSWFGVGNDCSLMRQHSSKSKARKAASAQITKIPFALSSYIARAYFPCPASK